MLQFVKFTAATLVGIILAAILGFILIISLVGSSTKSDIPEIKDKSVLVLRLHQPITEQGQENPFNDVDLPIPTGAPASIGLYEIVRAIKHAKTDEKIKGIYLNTEFTQVGYASLKEIRDALLDFKKSGKFIYAYGEFYTEGAYYLASVAKEIYLNPVGIIEFNGLSAEIPFLKGMFEKLEVKPEIFRVGDFKSAVEPLMLDKMSEENRLQIDSYLNSIYNTFLREIAETRQIPVNELERISDSLLVRRAEDAATYKLITNISYEDEVLDRIKENLKIDKKEKIPTTSLSEYSNFVKETIENKSKNRIAVLFAEGEIESGKSSAESIGSETIIKELRKLRKDEKVKAIVLRINSPGGSVLASDVMWREIQLTLKEKPIIASMSDVAASGGYYIAMGCDTIVAQPNTITGSIGVFAVLFNMQGLFENKLGITTDRVQTGAYADLGSPFKAFTEKERAIIQTSVDQIYETFTYKAAQGRNMSVEQLKKIASGRVWTGEQAKANGLVDLLGGLEYAIEVAAKKAKVQKDYSVKYYPVQESFFNKLFNKATEDVKAQHIQQEIGKEFYPYYKFAQKVRNWKGVQARLPYELTIK